MDSKKNGLSRKKQGYLNQGNLKGFLICELLEDRNHAMFNLVSLTLVQS